MGYWNIVEPVWDAINIYDGPQVFAQTFGSAPRASGLLFAAHFCQSEVCNGGFQQFFGNSTGVLAPEAVEGFHEIGQPQIAALIEEAMSLIGTPYPRDRNEREPRLTQISRSSLDALDEMFHSLIESARLAALKLRQTVTRLRNIQQRSEAQLPRASYC